MHRMATELLMYIRMTTSVPQRLNILCKMEDYDNAVLPVICEGWNLTRMQKALV